MNVDTELIRQVLAVSVVFGLLGCAVWFLGQRGNALGTLLHRTSRGNTHMQVIERLRLTPQHTVVMVRVADRRLLVALHPGGVTVLPGELPGPGESR
jgi:flagellar biogenesis protein FliO